MFFIKQSEEYLSNTLRIEELKKKKLENKDRIISLKFCEKSLKAKSKLKKTTEFISPQLLAEESSELSEDANLQRITRNLTLLELFNLEQKIKENHVFNNVDTDL